MSLVIDNNVVSELGDFAGMASEAVAVTSLKLCNFLDKQLNNVNSHFFIATDRYNPVDKWTAIVGNIFDTSLAELTIANKINLDSWLILKIQRVFKFAMKCSF